MTNNQSDWVFNIGLQIAVVICLSTLAVALFTGVAPLTAVFRSGTAFAVFVSLGWAAAVVWQVPEPEAEDEKSEQGNETDDPEPKSETISEPAYQPLEPEKVNIPTP
jgi:hypothetical protein